MKLLIILQGNTGKIIKHLTKLENQGKLKMVCGLLMYVSLELVIPVQKCRRFHYFLPFDFFKPFPFFSDVKKLASVIVKQWMSLVRNQTGTSGTVSSMSSSEKQLIIWKFQWNKRMGFFACGSVCQLANSAWVCRCVYRSLIQSTIIMNMYFELALVRVLIGKNIIKLCLVT